MKHLSLIITILLTLFIFTMSLINGTQSSELSSGFTLQIKNLLDAVFVNNSIEIDTLHRVVRKGAHIFEYFVLGLSYYLTAKYWKLSILKVLFIGLVTATVDEIIQSFTPDRVISAMDIFIYDFIGFALGFGLMILLFNQTKNISPYKTLTMLESNKISSKKAYRYLYDEKIDFTNRAHFVKLRIIVPGEVGVNRFLKVLFFVPLPLGIIRFGLKFAKIDNQNIPISKEQIIELITNKGIEIKVDAADNTKVFIKTI
ncbi:MAG: VanZ family protein [Candidatus Izimaplasma sp.]|nr:VanZ family protein [Candidatus Izimaplasma bacterium]